MNWEIEHMETHLMLYFVNATLFALYGFVMFNTGSLVKKPRFNRAFTQIAMSVTGFVFGFLEAAFLPYMWNFILMYFSMILIHTVVYTDTTLFSTLFDSGYFPLNVVVGQGIIQSAISLITGKGILELYESPESRCIILAFTTVFVILTALASSRIIPRQNFADLYKVKHYMSLVTAIELGLIVLLLVLLHAIGLQTHNPIITLHYLSIFVLIYLSFYLIMLFVVQVGIGEHKRVKQIDNLLGTQIEGYNRQADYIRSFRKYRHDFRDHIQTIDHLAQSGDFERLKNYIKEIRETQAAPGYKTYSNNTLIDAVINDCAASCERDGIRFDGTINVDGNLPLSDFDLSSLLLNLVQNAHEACQKPGVKDPFIRIASARKGNWNNFLIENSYNGVLKMKDGEYLTTKEEGSEQQGNGLRHVKQIVEANGGLINISPNEAVKEFSVFISFPILPGEDDTAKLH